MSAKRANSLGKWTVIKWKTVQEAKKKNAEARGPLSNTIETSTFDCLFLLEDFR